MKKIIISNHNISLNDPVFVIAEGCDNHLGNIDVAFEMFEQRGIKKIKVGGKNVAEGLIAKGKKGFFVATLDGAIKHAVPRKIIIFDSKKTVGVA